MIKASRRWIVLAALAVPASPVAAAPEGDTNPAVERAGDYLQVGIPLAALGLTFLLGDDEADDGNGSTYLGSGLALDSGWLHMNGSPRHDLLLAIGRTELATYTLKYSVDSERPNGAGQSFPSGHTSVAFAGAEFIRKEYGWGWGVPSYLAASYVGWSRVETKNHWASDVLAGAAIGILSNHDGLAFHLPAGEHGLEFSVAPTLMSRVTQRPGLFGFESPADLDSGAAEAPAPGLRFALRF